jgi:hypothetical protein
MNRGEPPPAHSADPSPEPSEDPEGNPAGATPLFFKAGIVCSRLLPRARAGDWVILVLALIGVATSLWWLQTKPHPWTVKEIAELADRGSRKYHDYLEPGLWLGALLSTLAWAPLLIFARWWPRGEPARYAVRAASEAAEAPLRPAVFWILLAAILIPAATLRWERLHLSYWGDEGWAVTRYSHGSWRPTERGDPQEPMRFWKANWDQAFFDDHTGGNHYLFSATQQLTMDAWRAITGRPRSDFSDPVSRLPSFVAGLASVALLAGLFRWAGLARTGLIAAFLLALHPMHLRYSSEARGYAMMLCFLIFTVWMAFRALKTGLWRWWLLFALGEFLTLYSWKGISYGMACFNLILLGILATGGGVTGTTPIPRGARFVAGGRWLAANLIAAGLYLRLAAPCLLQTKLAIAIAGGQPMYLPWLKNAIAQVLTGTPWNLHASNPSNVALYRLGIAHPLLATAIACSFIMLAIAGIRSLKRRWPQFGIVCVALPVSSIIGALHFKYRLEMEWQVWYSFYVVLAVIVVLAFGIVAWQNWLRRRFRGSPWLPRIGMTAAVLALVALQAPQTLYALRHPVEANREAFLATRGRHEPLHHSGPSTIHTVYLWRHIALYDPRAETKIRTGPALQEKIDQITGTQDELYVVMGEPALSRLLSGDMVVMLEDPALFTLQETFRSQEESLTLRVYHYTGPR